MIAIEHKPHDMSLHSWRKMAQVAGIALIIIVGLVFRIIVSTNTDLVDDAFITFRYANNIAQGNGFVYNPGEKVLGTTTPLFTLVLSLFATLSLTPENVGPALNILADTAIIFLIYYLLRRSVGISAAMLGASIYAVSLPNVRAAGYGMETGLYCLFIVLTFVAYSRGRFSLAAMTCALAVLTRIEGVILILAILLDMAISRKRPGWLPLIIFLALVIPWNLFATLYFGSPIPNSVWAKLGTYTSVLDILGDFFFHNLFKTLLTMLSLVGIYYVLRHKHDVMRLPLFWLVGYLGFFLITRPGMFDWYYAPAYVVMSMLAGFGVAAIIGAVTSIRAVPRKATGFVSVLACGAILLTTGYTLPKALADGAIGLEVRDKVFLPVAYWVRDNTSPADTIFTHEIGYLGYYSHRYITDIPGLVSPQVVSYLRGSEASYSPARLIEAVRPTVLAIRVGALQNALLADEWFTANYMPVERFNILGIKHLPSSPQPLSQDADLRDYVIYRMR